MAKRRKMDWPDLVDRGLQWYACFDNVLHKETGTKGSMYHMDKPLSAEDIAFIMQWKNTLITKGCYKYNPSDSGVDCIFIANKCIR